MLSWALEDQQSVLGAWASVRTWLWTSLSFFSRRCFEISLKVSAMEDGAGVSIWELGIPVLGRLDPCDGFGMPHFTYAT